MKYRTPILFGFTVALWLVVAVVVARANLLWPSPVLFRWHNLHQSSAMFRWQKIPTMGKDVMVTNASTSFLVVVPRKFSHGTLSISTVASDGFLTVTVPSRAGLSATMKTVAAGQPAEVDLDWSTLAVATRAFKVTVSAVDTSVQLRDINLTLTP